MPSCATRICTLLVVVAASVALVHGRAEMQTAQGFSLEQVLDYPFPANLVAAPGGAEIAWTFTERGARNIYIAEAPDFKPRRVTSYHDDDGQELSYLSFS